MKKKIAKIVAYLMCTTLDPGFAPSVKKYNAFFVHPYF